MPEEKVFIKELVKYLVTEELDGDEFVSSVSKKLGEGSPSTFLEDADYLIKEKLAVFEFRSPLYKSLLNNLAVLNFYGLSFEEDFLGGDKTSAGTLFICSSTRNISIQEVD